MKSPTIPEGFMFCKSQSGSGNIEITCTHPGCHEATTAAATDDLWARRFIKRHRALHSEPRKEVSHGEVRQEERRRQEVLKP